MGSCQFYFIVRCDSEYYTGDACETMFCSPVDCANNNTCAYCAVETDCPRGAARDERAARSSGLLMDGDPTPFFSWVRRHRLLVHPGDPRHHLLAQALEVRQEARTRLRERLSAPLRLPLRRVRHVRDARLRFGLRCESTARVLFRVSSGRPRRRRRPAVV